MSGTNSGDHKVILLIIHCISFLSQIRANIRATPPAAATAQPADRPPAEHACETAVQFDDLGDAQGEQQQPDERQCTATEPFRGCWRQLRQPAADRTSTATASDSDSSELEKLRSAFGTGPADATTSMEVTGFGVDSPASPATASRKPSAAPAQPVPAPSAAQELFESPPAECDGGAAVTVRGSAPSRHDEWQQQPIDGDADVQLAGHQLIGSKTGGVEYFVERRWWWWWTIGESTDVTGIFVLPGPKRWSRWN